MNPNPGFTKIKYEVGAVRNKPAVDYLEGYSLIVGGLIFVLVSIVFFFSFVNGFFDEVESIKTVRDINLLNLCIGLFGILFTLATGIGTIFMLVVGISTHKQNQDWMRCAQKARVTIIDRLKEETITQIDYKYGGYTMIYKLILQVSYQIDVPELDGHIILADVDKRIFNRYAQRDNLIIYYATNSPLTFILQGE